MEEDKKYWVGFNLVKGIGSARMKTVLDAFGSAEEAWRASTSELEQAGLSARLVDAVEKVRCSDALEITWEIIQQKMIQVLTWEDPLYPRRLKEIDQSPPLLYLTGTVSEQDQWTVAIVGTRRVTAYGRQLTEEIARGLAQNGVTVISGLARGVDSIAHQAALKNNGRTLAVLGSGVDNIYPPEHRGLAAQIVESGAIISDYPPGTPPEAANFPPRNRIISGLAQVVIVVEAGEVSGSLITASFAAEQNREVFAVPGYLYAPQSRGTNALIRSGAKIFIDLQDVLSCLNLSNSKVQREARSVLPADASEAQLYALLGREPLHIDEISMLSSLPIEQISAALAMMELKGMVRQMGGMRYIAVFEKGAEYSA